MSSFLTALATRRLIADGGFGSQLQARGMQAGEVPEEWCLTHPDAVRAIHADYFAAGSDFVLTNTFGATPVKLASEHSTHTTEELVAAAVRLAREAADAAQAADLAHRERFVALDMGPTGKLLAPLGDLEFEDAVANFAAVVRAGAAAGADLVVVETMTDLRELKAAVLAAKENCNLPVLATATFDDRGKLLTGADVKTVVTMLEGLRVDAVGMNCGLGPDLAAPFIREFLATTRLPVMLKPNAGLPKIRDGRTVFETGPAEFAATLAPLAAEGLSVVGGCCGTTPAHIAALAAAIANLPAPDVAARAARVPRETRIASGTHALVIGPRNRVIVGERINPTGKKRFQQALAEGDMPYVLRQAVEQREAGAHALDVNVGVAGLDEAALLPQVVEAVQTVVDAPLQLDTKNLAAMEAGLRRVNGKALVNSVSGERESLDAILPLVAKYGGVVVGLCLDENGIPETVDGRIAVGKKIIEAAAAYGIGPEDILLDPLCMTVSVAADAAVITLNALERITRELGVGSIAGVSNVSFGLPQREVFNANFFTMALHAGLTAAIVNPNSHAMIDAFRTANAVLGLDPNCATYIATHPKLAPAAPAAAAPAAAKAAPVSAAPAAGATLADAVRAGLRADAAARAAAALESGADPLVLIDGELVPALDAVGKKFEAGEMYLPQLLTAAEAANAAFAEIKRRLPSSQATKGKIIVATVKGDVHDIGKNIVRVLLENYGFDVIDLGKDVAPELVAETALKEGVKLVGLSALMTTTVGAMAETIRQLKVADPTIETMVGGAVLTQECADRIGATFYSRDAMGSVRFALKKSEEWSKQ